MRHRGVRQHPAVTDPHQCITTEWRPALNGNAPDPTPDHPPNRRLVTALATTAAVASLIAGAGADTTPPDGPPRPPYYVGGGVWGSG